MNRSPIDLYERLPAVYRRRDAERGYPLRALLEIISEQADVVKHDIEGLLDNFFVQTADEWAIPYIGDLVDNEPLHEVAQRRRVDVAKTIYYRRRKGTLPIIEEIARDVTGWGAHAVEFFELMGWTENLDHLRYQRSNNPVGTNPPAMDRVGTVNLRSHDTVDRVDGPFDELAHTADVRPATSSGGWHNIDNLGIFLWRLQSYPMEEVPAKPAATDGGTAYGFHFSPLGFDRPLFINPAPETSPTGLAKEHHVPTAIRPIALSGDLQDYRRSVQAGEPPTSRYVGPFTGQMNGFMIWTGGSAIDPRRIVCMDLEGWPRPPKELTQEGDTIPVEVAVDVKRGRMSFAPGQAPGETGSSGEGVASSFCYGFSSDLGGGPYDRRANLSSRDRDLLTVTVGKDSSRSDVTEVEKGIDEIINKWDPTQHDAAAVVIVDNGTYETSASLSLPEDLDLTLRAENRKRPLIRFVSSSDSGPPSALVVQSDTGAGAILRLNGLLVEGGLRVEAGSGLERLEVTHSTFVPGREVRANGTPKWPGRPSIVVEEQSDANGEGATLQVEVDRCITGSLRCPSTLQGLTIRDSIVDAPGEGPSARRGRALLSGYLGGVSFSDLPDTPELKVAIGEKGPFTLHFEHKPTSLSEVRDELRRALRSAHDSETFSRAIVEMTSEKLVVVPGVPAAEVRFETAGSDPTATDLRLVEREATTQNALVSAPLPPDLALESETPQLEVSSGADAPQRIEIEDHPQKGLPTSLPQVRDQLQRAIRDAVGGAALQEARLIKEQHSVSGQYQRLVLLTPPSGGVVRFRSAPADPETYAQLRLWTREAVGPPASTDWFAPPTTIERSTLIGETYVKRLGLASEVIFTRWVVAERRQTGCVRFSYVSPGSTTPQRYQCQPGLVVRERAEALREKGRGPLTDEQKEALRVQNRPSFTSRQYGNPAYAQLGPNCPDSIRTGGEEGSEMGAFNHLEQPQREANLRLRLREYLPFGLDDRLIYVT